MRLGFHIAVRFLKSNVGQTILIIMGIAIGVSVQIFIGSLIQGLQKSLIEKTIGDSAHITILPGEDEEEIEDYDVLYKKILGADERIESISFAADYPAFFELDDESKSVLVRGFDLKKADKIYDFSQRMVEGEFPDDPDEVMVGVGLRDEFHLKKGDMITLLTNSGNVDEFMITGFFDLKVASVNKTWVITTLKVSENLFGLDRTLTSIEIQLQEDHVFEADEVSKKLAGIIGRKFKTEDWKGQNEQLLSGLQGQSISSIMIQVFVLISVVLGIASVLAITVIQKSRQIGILKAMGIRNKSASFIFISEGLLLGIFGAIMGIALGLGLAYSFTKFAVNADGTPVVALYISNEFILLSGLIAVASSVAAALIPAVRSSRLNPIDIIRNN
ncbi:MAG: ABC transporter permease [Lachnospiraceae bacterium]|nr:ABC transporter permease [Lachnospiraceae bacterium]MDD3659865.1 ABC transporter permease [Lachnospiraceae bacterium]